MTFVNPEDYDRISQDDTVTISNIVDGMKNGILTVATAKGINFDVKCDLTKRQQAILLAGGLLNYTKEGGV